MNKEQTQRNIEKLLENPPNPGIAAIFSLILSIVAGIVCSWDKNFTPKLILIGFIFLIFSLSWSMIWAYSCHKNKKKLYDEYHKLFEKFENNENLLKSQIALREKTEDELEKLREQNFTLVAGISGNFKERKKKNATK